MKELTINKTKIALVFNYIIFAFVVIASIVMFSGYKFTYIKEPTLEISKIEAFKFFTVDSNILMGITALILAHQERKLLNKKIKDIPVGYYILKLVVTTSAALTFFVVFLYLGRIHKGGIISLLQNSNLFFHLIIPVLSIITFVLFEPTKKIKFNYVISTLIPILLYGIYYVIHITAYFKNGKVSPKIDWYSFAQDGISGVYVTSIVILVFTFVTGSIFWLLNRKD